MNQGKPSMKKKRFAPRGIAFVTIALLLLTTSSLAQAQRGEFLNFGIGVSLPHAAAGETMDAGWLLQTMGGITLPGGIVNLRVGSTYGQNRVRPATGGSRMAVDVAESGTSTTLSFMGGVMLTPILIAGVVPYTLADVGVMHARFQGSTNAFTWQVGGGLLVNASSAGWFIESRYMQARKNGNRGAMVPIAAGVRFMW
jgi:hypothetical protein